MTIAIIVILCVVATLVIYLVKQGVKKSRENEK